MDLHGFRSGIMSGNSFKHCWNEANTRFAARTLPTDVHFFRLYDGDLWSLWIEVLRREQIGRTKPIRTGSFTMFYCFFEKKTCWSWSSTNDGIQCLALLGYNSDITGQNVELRTTQQLASCCIPKRTCGSQLGKITEVGVSKRLWTVDVKKGACPSLAGEHLAVGIDGDTTGHTSLGAECEPDPGVSERWLWRYFGG